MSDETNAGGIARIRVWDLFVRLFHWSLVAAYFIAYFTEDELMGVHVWAGYVVGALIVLRILWGFVGPRHARFRDFAYGPRAALRYLLALVTFRAERHVGHSPAGAVMVYALLAGLLLAVASGLLAHGAEGKGPLATLFAEDGAPIITVIAGARANGKEDGRKSDRRERKEEFWEEVHEVFANLTLILILLHIGGVALASLVHRENLPRAMITGRKRP
ncbi:MAG: cytochrome b/b6 domain-containing protein [Alphaproteobacteria bacterium]